MTKARSPLSLEGAFARVREILGRKVCAQILGLSVSAIDKRCNAEHVTALRYIEVIRLDAACQEKCGETPLFDYRKRKIEATPCKQESLVCGALELNAEIGEVDREINALLDPKTHAMRPLSTHVAIELQHHLHAVAARAVGLEHILTEPQTQGARA